MDIVTWTSTSAGSFIFRLEDPVPINLVLRPVGTLVVFFVQDVPLVVPVPGEPRTVGPSFLALLAREYGVSVSWTSLVSEGAGVGLAAGAERLLAIGAGVEGLGATVLPVSVRTLLLVILANIEHELGC